MGIEVLNHLKSFDIIAPMADFDTFLWMLEKKIGAKIPHSGRTFNLNPWDKSTVTEMDKQKLRDWLAWDTRAYKAAMKIYREREIDLRSAARAMEPPEPVPHWRCQTPMECYGVSWKLTNGRKGYWGQGCYYHTNNPGSAVPFATAVEDIQKLKNDGRKWHHFSNLCLCQCITERQPFPPAER